MSPRQIDSPTVRRGPRTTGTPGSGHSRNKDSGQGRRGGIGSRDGNRVDKRCCFCGTKRHRQADCFLLGFLTSSDRLDMAGCCSDQVDSTVSVEGEMEYEYRDSFSQQQGEYHTGDATHGMENTCSGEEDFRLDIEFQ